jgi:hypothetical protein
MTRRFLLLGVLAAALVAVAPNAQADGGHGGHGSHGGHGGHGGHGCCGHGGSRAFFGFNFGAPLYSSYPYYYAPPVYYAPPPVYYAPPPAAYAVPPSPSVSPGQAGGQGCREYTAPITIDGRVVQSHGTVCPRPDGSWQIMN